MVRNPQRGYALLLEQSTSPGLATCLTRRKGTRLNEIGEFGLIERIGSWVKSRDLRVIVGMGDDAAVLDEGGESLSLVTIDAFVEGVHFDRAYTSFYQVGWKAMAANLSDIAAMGGRPSVAVVSLTVPGDLTVQDIEALYQGIEALGGRFGCDTVGGDTTSSPGPIVLSIAVLGKVGRGLVALRSAARVGDQICVTGHLGGAAAGLEVLQRGSGAALRKREREAARRHLEPLPRVREAEGLTQAGLVHAMIDISDGLASDLHHICRQSKVGAKILEDRIPIDSSTEQIAQGCRCSALDFALSGGEDFELLFTSGSEDLGRCSPDVAFSVIGEIVERQAGVVLCKKDGTSEQLPASGYVHFAGGT